MDTDSNDYLNGGAGNDTLVGGGGNDYLVGEDGKWSVAVLGKNLSDETTYAWRNDVTLSDSNSYFGVPQRPRSVALQARYRF